MLSSLSKDEEFPSKGEPQQAGQISIAELWFTQILTKCWYFSGKVTGFPRNLNIQYGKEMASSLQNEHKCTKKAAFYFWFISEAFNLEKILIIITVYC